MTVSITKLYDLLSLKLGKEEAESLTTYIQEKSQTNSTKNDLQL